jgi:hypothetical protein
MVYYTLVKVVSHSIMVQKRRIVLSRIPKVRVVQGSKVIGYSNKSQSTYSNHYIIYHYVYSLESETHCTSNYATDTFLITMRFCCSRDSHGKRDIKKVESE